MISPRESRGYLTPQSAINFNRNHLNVVSWFNADMNPSYFTPRYENSTRDRFFNKTSINTGAYTPKYPGCKKIIIDNSNTVMMRPKLQTNNRSFASRLNSPLNNLSK